MSGMLEVRDGRGSRSKSPGGRDRSRSRSHTRDTRDEPSRGERPRSKKYDDDSDHGSADDRSYRKASKKYYDEDDDDSDKRRRGKGSKSKYDESEEEDRYRSKSSRDYESSARRRDVSVSGDERPRERSRRDKKRSDSDDERREKSRRSNYDDEESGSEVYSRRKSKYKADSDRESGRENGYPPYAPAPPGAFPESRHMSYVPPPGTDPRLGTAPQSRGQSFGGPAAPRYAEVDKFQYASPSAVVSAKYKDSQAAPAVAAYADRRPEYERSRPSDESRRGYERTRDKKYEDDRYERRDPRDRKYDDRYETRESKRDKKYGDDRYSSSPEDLKGRLSKMAVGGTLGAATLGVAGALSHGGGKPPASPLLEAYKGTYQSISPMPSPIMSSALVSSKYKQDADLSDLDLDSEDSEHDEIKRKIRKLEKERAKYEAERGGGRSNGSKDQSPRSSDLAVEIREPGRRSRAGSFVDGPPSSIMSPGTTRERKKVAFYDPTADAKRIAAALGGREPDPRPLLTILPPLSTDDLLALRTEYKKHAKVGGQGINIAKHIKAQIPGSLGKACYATALGRWESEAYWANSFYQGGASRRELLIEALMGRSNSDIREIKNCFRDKKYNDDLDKCIRTELKADKFRTAVLLALEEKRMPESSPLDMRLVKADVGELYRALTAPGGESLMIGIIVVRSDAHLREVLRMFEGMHRINFAREMITKSRNLVGETLAHILNGALNRPMRDALLLHQAIAETAPGKERTELLISRLVRMHWEAKHLEKVEECYHRRYGVTVEDHIRREVRANMKTAEGKMCADYCVALVRSNDAGVMGVKSAFVDTRESHAGGGREYGGLGYEDVREIRPAGGRDERRRSKYVEEVRPRDERKERLGLEDGRERERDRSRDRRSSGVEYDSRDIREIRPR